MPSLKQFFFIASAISFVGSLTACTTPKKTIMHKDEFGMAEMFTYAVPGNEQEACEASRRALLRECG